MEQYNKHFYLILHFHLFLENASEFVLPNFTTLHVEMCLISIIVVNIPELLVKKNIQPCKHYKSDIYCNNY